MRFSPQSGLSCPPRRAAALCGRLEDRDLAGDVQVVRADPQTRGEERFAP